MFFFSFSYNRIVKSYRRNTRVQFIINKIKRNVKSVTQIGAKSNKQIKIKLKWNQNAISMMTAKSNIFPFDYDRSHDDNKRNILRVFVCVCLLLIVVNYWFFFCCYDIQFNNNKREENHEVKKLDTVVRVVLCFKLTIRFRYFHDNFKFITI